MKEVTLSVETLNAILGYLGSRPYQEVYQIINAIQEAAKPKDEDGVGGN